MKKNIITIAVALLIGSMAMADNQRVAVFDPAGNAERHINEIVREIFSSAIVNTAGFVVLERSLIDRVLAENLFQAEGLVDDAEISEMGRMMGANLVLVANLTRMSDGNFFISARLIDVMTARIQKQQTVRTSRAGETELINTVERLAGEMFVQQAGPAQPTRPGLFRRQETPTPPPSQQPIAETPPPAPPQQPIVETPPPAPPQQIIVQTPPPARQVVETPPPAPAIITADMFIAQGRNVFQGGRELTQMEVRQIMSNAQNFSALAMYDRGIQRNRTGNIWLWCGVGVTAAGGAVMIIRPWYLESTWTLGWTGDTIIEHDYWPSHLVGLIVGGVGILSVATGIILKATSRGLVRNAVNMHNQGLLRADSNIQLNFGVTQNGVGLVLNF